jgi:vancomycin permeability regulator SanA
MKKYICLLLLLTTGALNASTVVTESEPRCIQLRVNHHLVGRFVWVRETTSSRTAVLEINLFRRQFRYVGQLTTITVNSHSS